MLSQNGEASRIEREVEPKENYMLAIECGALEKKAEGLRQKGFMQPIEGSRRKLKKSIIELIISKAEARAQQSEFLFQVEALSSKLHVFSIPKKKKHMSLTSPNV